MSALQEGDRVEMAEDAIKQRLDGRRHSRRAVVRAVMQDGRIRIKRRGMKAPETWSADFWRIAK